MAIQTSMTAYQLADEAIDMFLEYRDKHGYSERDARHAAASEVDQGVDAEIELRRMGEIAPEGAGYNWPRPQPEDPDQGIN